MSVDFTDNGDGTSDCDVCGETIDNDHYYDMQAHDQKHYDEQLAALAMPRFVVFRVSSTAWSVLEKYVMNDRHAYYKAVATTTSPGDADRISEALGRA